MAMGRPLFNGSNDGDQLFKIFRVLGKPSAEVWPTMHEYPNAANVFASEQFAAELPPTWEAVFHKYGVVERLGPKGVDLLLGLLRYEPSHRLNATDALRHPYFSERFGA